MFRELPIGTPFRFVRRDPTSPWDSGWCVKTGPRSFERVEPNGSRLPGRVVDGDDPVFRMPGKVC